MKKQVTFSIIIPMHNAEKFILEALKSLEIQHFKNYECLVIDDHSTDNSKKIVEDYQKKNLNISIQIYETKMNKWGPGSARNIGMDNAKGEYILFLDADDKLNDEYVLEKINETIKQNPNVEIILLGHKKVWYSKNGKVLREKQYFPKRKHMDKCYQIARNMEGIIWSYCFKSELFQKNKIRFPENTIWEDLIPKLILFSHAKPESIKRNLYITHQYNIRPGKSIGTAPTFSKLKSLIKVYKDCNHLIEERMLDKKYQKDIKIRMLLFPVLLFWMLNRLIYFKISKMN